VRWNCTDELADAWIHRPLAGVIAARLAPTRVGADHVTLLACGLGLSAAFYLALGHPAAGPLLVLHLVFDCVDGQLARRRGPSRHGRWLDGLADSLVGVALYGALWARGLPLAAVAAAGGSLLLRGMIFDGLKARYKGAADIPVYTAIQERLVGEGPVSPAFMRLAGLGGVTTHHVVLAVSALSGDYGVFMAYAAILANFLLAVLMAARRWRGK
jgi:phosphatidylglycerophosphate synthase